MRLNLGCGDDIRSGYTNVDFRNTHPSVLNVDLSVFPWPFEDASTKQILMLDCLEHFPYSQTSRILLECHRILQKHGEVVIQVPDARILGAVISSRGTFQCNRCGQLMHGETERDLKRPNRSDGYDSYCTKCGQLDSDLVEAAMMRMFGGQDHHGNFHQTCFTHNSLIEKASSCGLEFKEFVEHDHQAVNWNMKAVFMKGDVW